MVGIKRDFWNLNLLAQPMGLAEEQPWVEQKSTMG